jgi:hypothetical protein
VRGGLALEKVAQSRERPIPFFGELGSVNPVVALPAALAANGAELAKGLAGSITVGCGQFCTSPGVILVPAGAAGDAFVATLVDALRLVPTHAMLTPHMRAGFEAGCAAWAAHPHLQPLLADCAADGEPPRPFLAQVDGGDLHRQQTPARRSLRPPPRWWSASLEQIRPSRHCRPLAAR